MYKDTFFEKKVQKVLVGKNFALYLHSQSGTNPKQCLNSSVG